MNDTDPIGWYGPALKVLAAVLLLLLAVSIPGHQIHLDEPWIGEQAYTLATDGYVHSNLFEGFARVDERSIAYHRLFVRAGSAAIDMFGWGVFPLRLVSLLSGAILCALMIVYCRRMMPDDLSWSLLPLVLLLLIPLCFEFVKIYRPEFMTTMFGLASFLALDAFVRRGNWYHVVLCGVMAGSSVLAHPYGLVYPVAAFLMLALMRRWRYLPLLVLAGTVVLVPYALEIQQHYELFILQISNPIVADKTTFTLATPFVNLLDEHKRLFRTVEIVPISALFLLSLLPAFRDRSDDARLLYRYTLILVIVLGMLTPDKLTRYGILLFPFFAISITLAIRTMITRPESRKGRPWIGFLRASLASVLFNLFGAILFGYGLYYAGATAFGRKQDAVALNQQIARNIPSGSRVVAPMNFLFDQIPNYHIIALRYANFMTYNRLSVDTLLAFASHHRADAIVFNRYQAVDEGVIDLEEQWERLGKTHRVIEGPHGSYSVVMLK